MAADVQRPQVCLLKSSIHFDAFLDVPTSATAVLFNQTALATAFEWGEPTCAGAADVEVDVRPRRGVIGARQEAPVTVTVTARALGPAAADLLVPCRVDGMDRSVSLRVTADVVNLIQLSIISYSVSGDRESWLSGDEMIIDFGGNNRLRDTPKLYLRIQNVSDIATDYRLQMEFFPSALVAEKSKKETALCERGMTPVMSPNSTWLVTSRHDTTDITKHY